MAKEGQQREKGYSHCIRLSDARWLRGSAGSADYEFGRAQPTSALVGVQESRFKSGSPTRYPLCFHLLNVTKLVSRSHMQPCRSHAKSAHMNRVHYSQGWRAGRFSADAVDRSALKGFHISTESICQLGAENRDIPVGAGVLFLMNLNAYCPHPQTVSHAEGHLPMLAWCEATTSRGSRPEAMMPKGMASASVIGDTPSMCWIHAERGRSGSLHGP